MEQNKDLQHSLLADIMALIVKTPSLVHYQDGNDNSQRFIFDYSHKYIIHIDKSISDFAVLLTDVQNQITYTYSLNQKENMDVVQDVLPSVINVLEKIYQNAMERKMETMNKFLEMVASDISSLIKL